MQPLTPRCEPLSESERTVRRATRRDVLNRIGLAALTIPAARLDAFALQAASSIPYDLLITGGRVVDPSQNLSAERDVAIVGGRIARIDANIPRGQARQVF